MAFRTLAPSLLLAAPRLKDPNFERTVVLLGKHEQDGALGWILNGANLHSVGELLRAAELLPSEGELPDTQAFRRRARIGGPVHPESGWLLYHTRNASFPGEVELGRLAVCNRPEALQAVIQGEPPHDFRLFLGYAGWGPGQLESEMKEGVWFPGPFDPDLILETTGESLWEEAFERATGLPPSHFTHSEWGRA